VFSSLNGAGRKLLGSLASQEDAVMLQRRLDEMNQRWHHLKAKSLAIRYVQSAYYIVNITEIALIKPKVTGKKHKRIGEIYFPS
jgi:hypothetical protein